MKSIPRLIVAALFVGIMVSSPASGAEEEDDFFRFENKPKFDSTSSAPVLLRYKFKAGQVMKMAITTEMDRRMNVVGLKLNSREAMSFDVKASVTEVDSEGNMSLLMKITRCQMKMSGLQELSFDSDDENSEEAFKPLMAMINVGIPCQMSPVGEMLETDLEPMRLAMRRAGNAAAAQAFEKSTEKMFEGAFVFFFKEPIKAGETYKGGTMIDGPYKVHMSYKVQSVSGDGRKAIMEPVAKIELDVNKTHRGLTVRIDKSRMEGWTLHDVEKGWTTEAEVRMHLLVRTRGPNGEPSSDERKVSTTMKMTVAE